MFFLGYWYLLPQLPDLPTPQNLRGGLSGWGVRTPNGSSLTLRSTGPECDIIPSSPSWDPVPFCPQLLLQRISSQPMRLFCLKGESKPIAHSLPHPCCCGSIPPSLFTRYMQTRISDLLLSPCGAAAFLQTPDPGRRSSQDQNKHNPPRLQNKVAVSPERMAPPPAPGHFLDPYGNQILIQPDQAPEKPSCTLQPVCTAYVANKHSC
jgi:hypothetical protein